MLQRIIAALLIVGGLVVAGLGVASATVWRESDTVVASATPGGDGTLVVTAPGVLDLVDPDVTIRARVPAGQKVTIAVGREVDVDGWVGSDQYTEITGLDTWSVLATRAGTPKKVTDEASDGASPAETPAASPSATPAPSATATPAPADAAAADQAVPAPADPTGSDMWLAQATGEGTVNLRWSDRPGRWTLLAAGVGADAKAPTVELSWPRVVTTPWLWPGVVAGAVLLAAGIALLVVALRSPRPARQAAGTKRRGTRATSGDTDQTTTGTGADGTIESVAVSPTADSAMTQTLTVTPTPEPAETVPVTETVPVAATARRRKRKGDDLADGGPQVGAVSESTDRAMTRREKREREEARRASERADKPRRWRTGQIPVVAAEDRPVTGAHAAVVTPAPDAEEASTQRSDAWRKAWGFASTGPSGGHGTHVSSGAEDGSPGPDAHDGTTEGTR